jgi:FMN phosphatase YigB (HAD superfamily)
MVPASIKPVAPRTSIRLVCFDLGGVLVRISRTWAQAMETAKVQSPLGNLDLPLSACPAFEEYQAGAIGSEEYTVRLAEFLGGVPIADARRVHAGILIEPYPGTYELVQELRTAGFLTGCLSNTNEPHWQLMCLGEDLPGIAALDIKVASHDIKAQKPHPDSFLAFEERSGVTGEHIAFFDDSEENVRTAARQGWNAHWVDYRGDTALQMRGVLDSLGVLR